ncbi:unnamed protein product [Trifolium pratense]|uniref:Uncharacterized protein n=1 Tax=Trifolium pratense TaxID=57577 RepID=A0ACB0JKX6_TRIPR|nr:unnamed protein product [Trifolium pratense]
MSGNEWYIHTRPFFAGTLTTQVYCRREVLIVALRKGTMICTGYFLCLMAYQTVLSWLTMSKECFLDISPSQFEAHAGMAARRQPYQLPPHIYFQWIDTS